jgi:hypothetical protein
VKKTLKWMNGSREVTKNKNKANLLVCYVFGNSRGQRSELPPGSLQGDSGGYATKHRRRSLPTRRALHPAAARRGCPTVGDGVGVSPPCLYFLWS